MGIMDKKMDPIFGLGSAGNKGLFFGILQGLHPLSLLTTSKNAGPGKHPRWGPASELKTALLHGTAVTGSQGFQWHMQAVSKYPSTCTADFLKQPWLCWSSLALCGFRKLYKTSSAAYCHASLLEDFLIQHCDNHYKSDATGST